MFYFCVYFGFGIVLEVYEPRDFLQFFSFKKKLCNVRKYV